MRGAWKFGAAIALVTLVLARSEAQPLQASIVEQCALALQQDLYSYASSLNLREDYLRIVDEETWNRMSKEIETWGSYFEVIKGGGDYRQFDERRRKYFESIHYTRDLATATSVLSLTTKKRAYDSYDKCIQSLGGGPPVILVVETEDQNAIVMKACYRPPINAASITISGSVSGGSVDGQPAGMLFPDKTVQTTWEQRVRIKRSPGVPETVITVTPSAYGAPQIWHSKHADGWIEISADGTADAVIGEKSVEVLTEDNNERDEDDNCRSKVGAKDGYCLSGNRNSVRAPHPQFFSDPKAMCVSGGCGWTRGIVASLSEDNHVLNLYGENWGPRATLQATATLHQTYGTGGASCQATGRVPVVFGRPINLSILTACQGIALVSYEAEFGAGQIKFDAPTGSGDGKISRIGALIETDGVAQGSFVLQPSN